MTLKIIIFKTLIKYNVKKFIKYLYTIKKFNFIESYFEY